MEPDPWADADQASSSAYAEPDVDSASVQPTTTTRAAATADDDDEPIYTSSYPPKAPSPFNVSRIPEGRLELPAASSSKRMPPLTPPIPSVSFMPDEMPSPGPGVDGPLTYATTPKSSTRGGLADDVVLGVVLVDFNHLVGPTVEWSHPPSLTAAFRKDEELGRLLPFLALPDGAHLKEEDYCYFHCVYNPPPRDVTLGGQANEAKPEDDEFPAHQTLFGISCNRQIASTDLLNRPEDVTRSTVQKALVVLASRPVFGPIRDKLGLVTRALFAQRDFTNKTLLTDLYTSLEIGLQGKGDEASMYIGTSLRELLHTFRHRTLVLVKMMMLQKRILLFGYPVETLCTYQYSLISLMPGLLMNVADCGDPSLDFRSTSSRRASTLRTSDRNSLLRYMGLPLHTFGKGAFFQPYLPLQQIDMLTSHSWLVGTTNSIVTQQKDCQWDLLVNIEQTSFQFSDPALEKMVSLTPSDRLWMDQVIRSVEDTWNPADPTRPSSMSFRGSDDDLRSRFEEYICSALASLKYQDYSAAGKTGVIMPGELPVNVEEPFGESWLEAFRKTPSYRTWTDSTDEMLFDICEPRHPVEGKVNAVSDIGIRLAEGLHDLKLEQQLGPTREAIGSAIAAGSTGLFNVFNGVRNEVTNRLKDQRNSKTLPSDAVVISGETPPEARPTSSLPDFRSAVNGFGSFFGSRLASLQQQTPPPPSAQNPNRQSRLRPLNLRGSTQATDESRPS